MSEILRIPHPMTRQVRNFHRMTFAAYAQYVHGLQAAHFQRTWARRLKDPRAKRLVIVAPPESGKTAWCIALCAWMIGRNPNIHLGYLGNTAQQAYRQSVAIRDTIRHNPRFREVYPNVILDPAKGTAEREWFVRRGDTGDKDATFIASGFRGPVLGARLDVVIVDDYSDQENTATPEQQEKAWEWLQQNVLTRLNPERGRLVCIQTRWADGDVVGRFENAGAEIMRFQALSDEGEPLWPARWDSEALAIRRAELGSRLFDLHYQGLVISRDADVFKPAWWRYWQAPTHFPTGGVTTVSIDTAAKTGEHNDYSAATVWTCWNNEHYLIHAWRGRLEYPDLVRKVESFIDEWRPKHLLIEDTGTGQALIQELRVRNRDVTPVRPTADKLTRAVAATPLIEAGKVLLPSEAGWLDEFRYELDAFPRAKHDDWVDSVSQYLELAPTLTWDPLAHIWL